MTAGSPNVRPAVLSERTTDILLATAVGAAMALIISVAQEQGATRPSDALAYLLGLPVAVLLLARRRHPLLVLLGSVGTLFIYAGLNYPAFSLAVPLAAAAYSAAVAGHLVAAATIVAATVAFTAGWQTLGEHESVASVVGTNTLADAALLAAVLLLGEAVRNRRAWAGEVRRRLERADRDRERDAVYRVEQERLRIARELHDVIAHTIGAINVQAGVAADVIDDAPDQARASLRTIREHSRGAIAELSQILGLLRSDGTDPPRTPAPGLDRLDHLIETVGTSGLRVDVSRSGRARPLPGSVNLTAYRIVQESLTNVLRHADASAATVSIRYDDDVVLIDVEDDGQAVPPRNSAAPAAGHGLVGMRERAVAVGGTLHAGPRPEGGFRVRARLPATPAAP